LFRLVARTGVEPELCELMPYYERDEARHVGLGVLYLPELLAREGRLASAALQWYQLKVNVLITWATMRLRDEFDTLGVDVNESLRYGGRKQTQVIGDMREVVDAAAAAAAAPGDARPRAVFLTPRSLRLVNSWNIDLMFPPPGRTRPAWQRAVHGALGRVARRAERLLEVGA
jgi:hypothetical protein